MFVRLGGVKRFSFFIQTESSQPQRSQMSNSNQSGDINQPVPRVGSLLNEFHLIDETDEDSDLFKKKTADPVVKKRSSLFDGDDDDEEDLLGFRTKDDDEKKYLTMTFGEGDRSILIKILLPNYLRIKSENLFNNIQTVGILIY